LAVLQSPSPSVIINKIKRIQTIVTIQGVSKWLGINFRINSL
jgi:hypothetical protein